MAACAGLADVARIHRRRRVRGAEDIVLAVAIGADGRFAETLCDRFSMDRLFKLLLDFVMAHAAGLRNGLLKFGCTCLGEFVRRAVAGIATGRARVTFLQFLAVDAGGVAAHLIRVTGNARGLRRIGSMWIFVMLDVTGGAADLGVARLADFRRHVMAAGACLVFAGRLSALFGRVGGFGGCGLLSAEQ